MKIYTYLIPVLLVVCILASCSKEAVNTKGQDPYEEVVLPAISIRKDGISPAQGKINDAVVIAGKGFSKNKEQMSVLFNGRKAEVLEVTDTTVKVKVPILASSGGVSIQVGQQYFFGPFFRVQGSFEMDVNYPSYRGANNVILDVIPDGDKFVIVGDFTDYDNKGYKFGINRVARINQNGTFDESFSHDVERGGSNSFVACVSHGPNNKYFVGGGFNSFDNIPYANSIARLNRDGKVETDRITRAISGKDETISALKGGVSGQISAIYVQPDDKMIIMGGFQYYVKPNFDLISSDGRDSTHLDSTRVNNIIRLYPNGILDTSYNYDLANHRGKEGANGSINKTIFLPDGKLLIAGNFTKFNGQDARRIARLNTDGSLDPSFNPGAGADLSVYNIERQPDGKILLMGAFNNYNGQRVMNVVRITADGAYDPSFKVAKGTDGAVFAAGIMPGGEIILSGFFEKFDDVVRNNIVVLNADGSLHPTYNTNGGITLGPNSSRGGVAKILQIPNEKAMLMVGSFTKFDYNSSNRIVKIKYQ